MAVSVIIPNYNNEPYIEQCIRSVADDPAVSEIIVYDDCSTDASARIAGGLGISKVRILHGESKARASIARDNGVQVSTCEFLCFLDGDDFLSPLAVSKGLEALRATKADFSLFSQVRVDVEGSRVIEEVSGPPERIDGKAAFMLSLGDWSRIHTRGVFRRSLYDKALKRFVPYGYLDDDLLGRLQLLSAVGVCGNEGSYFYRWVVRPPTTDRIVGITRHRIRTIAIAREEGIDSDSLRRERNMAVRNLIGIILRTARGEIEWSETQALMTEFSKLQVRWGAGDLPYLVAAVMLNTIAKFPHRVDPRTVG